MRRLSLLLVPLLLTACPRLPTYDYPDPPATLDYGPHPAFLGSAVTITGPATEFGKVGAPIYDDKNPGHAPYGEMLAGRRARVTLPATPPPNWTTGPVRTLIPNVLPIFISDFCSLNTITASVDATYAVPSFSTASASYTGQLRAQMSPGSPYTRAFPATIGSSASGYLLTGRLVYVDQDVTLTGKMVCTYQDPSNQTLEVNVELRAGWNVLREQGQVVGSRGDAYAITGGAADYTVEP
ncbi:hypothetical protein HNQ07_003604 [Deinococcus metalli]|uniref:Lipoprotein n=1 Tax=Deinococcus metalli TaxID=1141878 RepID=A0A7W8KHX8_9DEIO|nr:hypothetical protein [Deinococcus metalli]MBB5378103.1 hypothetical protein [Deinococcus metalli]GHF54464.1 hypothetical protein GCM10017781_33470 [Deinococcus metalli]